LIRCLREDRSVIFASDFIKDILNEEYTKPVSDTVESIWNESNCKIPILFLLSAGADPTSSIDDLAKKKKKYPTDPVSMGEGQDVIAREKMKDGFLAGSWVILQNCHLGLGFMEEIEGLLGK
jgi:dynein heavy chain